MGLAALAGLIAAAPTRGARQGIIEPMQPMTHHDIMALVAPFSAAGCRVDLAASDRLRRRVAFRPAAAASPAADGLPALVESLWLDNPGPDFWQLTRRLQRVTPTAPAAAAAGEPVAELVAEGADPAALLAAVQAVPAARQWRCEAGHWMALSHRVEVASGRLTLTQAAARLPGLRLAMTVSRVSGIPAVVELQPEPDGSLALPDDLLAVLGLRWSVLKRLGSSWRASVKLAGQGAERGHDAEARLAQAVSHLAATLAEPPARFHQRHRRARWRVVARRLTPLGVALALIAGAASVHRLEIGPDSVLRMLIFNAPPLLLVWFFSMRELPRVEIPPLPREPLAADWRSTPP